MTNLYIANGTHNNIDFSYSLPAVAGHRIEWIPIGRQSLIGDFSDIELDAIIQHYSIYGLIEADDLESAAPGTYVAFIYSTDTPVSDTDVIALLEHNYPGESYRIQNIIYRIKADGTQ